MLSIRYPVLWAVAAVALLVNTATAAPPAKPAKPTKEQIAKWIKELGDADFETREEASKKLWEAGSAAKEALELARTSDDVEVKRRAREVLDKFKWGIYPDTPKKIIDLITTYQTADAAGKPAAVKKFFAAGAAGVKALLDVVRSEKRGEFKDIIFKEVALEGPKVLPRLLADKDYDMVEALLEVNRANDDQESGGQMNYVAYWLLRGKTAERIAHYQRLADKGLDAKKNYTMVALLQRAAGNLVAARQAADKAGRPGLAEACLYEAGDWKALAGLKDIRRGTDAIQKLGYRAAFHRLAGNTKGFEEALKAIQAHAKSPGGMNQDAFACAKALLLNDRPTEGMALLDWHLHFEVLAGQVKMAEALALLDKALADKKNAEVAPQIEVLKARTLYELGETDKARTLFDRLAKEIKAGGKEGVWIPLIEAEYRVGLHDVAFEHLARILELPKAPEWVSSLFPKVFGDRAGAAEALWTLQRQKSAKEGRKVGADLQMLRALLAGKVAAKDLTELVKAGKERARTIRAEAPAGNEERKRSKNEEADRLLLALADAATAAGQDRLAADCLEDGKTRLALIRLGDILAAKKEWDKAADRYRQAWEADRTQPLPLFLRGKALAQGGSAKDGKKWIELSHWLPLGNGTMRKAFTEALIRRGYTDDARRENDLLQRTGDWRPGSSDVPEALRRRAFFDPDRKDPFTTALRHEQGMLRCVGGSRFVQGGAYVGVPAMIHTLRARGYLLAGKGAEAEKEVALARAAQPGYVELPINVVPALDKLGRKKEAAALFDQTLAVYEKLCRDYPRYASAHNSAAWVSACCRRNLDKAQAHAEKAVKLAPTNAGYVDTLAEVYFQRGDKDKAIQTQKKAIALDPKKSYFRKQLKRIEAGDPTAERPPENED